VVVPTQARNRADRLDSSSSTTTTTTTNNCCEVPVYYVHKYTTIHTKQYNNKKVQKGTLQNKNKNKEHNQIHHTCSAATAVIAKRTRRAAITRILTRVVGLINFAS
jgi:hypothetical protein